VGRARVRNARVVGRPATGEAGLQGLGVYRDNTVVGFSQPYLGSATNGVGNV
jgi:hypothetical protein